MSEALPEKLPIYLKVDARFNGDDVRALVRLLLEAAPSDLPLRIWSARPPTDVDHLITLSFPDWPTLSPAIGNEAGRSVTTRFVRPGIDISRTPEPALREWAESLLDTLRPYPPTEVLPAFLDDGGQTDPVEWSLPALLRRAEEVPFALSALERLLAAARSWLDDPGSADPEVVASVEADLSILAAALRSPQYDLVTISRAGGRISTALTASLGVGEISSALADLGVDAEASTAAAEDLIEAAESATAFALEGEPEQAMQAAESIEHVADAITPLAKKDIRDPWEPGDPWIKGRIAHLTDGIDSAIEDPETVKQIAAKVGRTGRRIRNTIIVTAVSSSIAAILRAMFG